MKNLKLDAHKRQWYAYYSEKRIVHQWFQVKLLENLPVQRIMEIGPAYGVPTALLANAGYEVTTLDFMERKLLGASSHIIADLWKADPKVYSNQDCILCCEVLEHFPFEKSCDLLTKFYKSKVPYLVLSVPYYLRFVRIVFFYDAGQVRDFGQDFSMDSFKTSTGIELRFFIPMLNVPFRLIYAWNPQSEGVYNDRLLPQEDTVFRFAVGTTF